MYIYQNWKFGDDRSCICWDIWWDMPIFASSSQKLHFPLIISGVAGPVLIKFAWNVSKILPFNICKSELRYSDPFRNDSVLKEGQFPKIGCQGNVPWKIRKRSGSIKFKQIASIWWKNRDNWSNRSWDTFAWVKKINKKLTQEKIHSPSGKFAEWAKKSWYLYNGLTDFDAILQLNYSTSAILSLIGRTLQVIG